MFDNEETAPTLLPLAGSKQENPLVSSGMPRLVVEVWTWPYCGPDGFLPVIHPLLNQGPSRLASLDLAPDLRSASERYQTLRHNHASLRDVLNEGALVVSRIISPAITRLREYLHLNDGSGGRT